MHRQAWLYFLSAFVFLNVSFGCTASGTDNNSSQSPAGAESAPQATSSSSSNAAAEVAGKEDLPSDFPVSLDPGASRVEIEEIEEHEYKLDIYSTKSAAEAEAYYKSSFQSAGWTIAEGVTMPTYEKSFAASNPKKSAMVQIGADGTGSKIHFVVSSIDE